MTILRQRRSLRLITAVAAVAAVACSGGESTAPNNDAQFQPPVGLKPVLDAVKATLAANPPSTTGGNAARKAAIQRLDSALWLVSVIAPAGDDITSYYASQMNKVAAEMAQPVTAGVRIWAGYNAGFIVKSADKTVAFDLIDGRPGFTDDKPVKTFGYTIPASVINQIDVLVISHEHGDHRGNYGEVAARVKAHGGAVLYPRAAAIALADATILVDSGSTGTVSGVSYVALKQPHGGTMNIGYQLTLPNGYKIVHQDAEYTQIEKVKNIDVLFENVWINGSTGICKDAIIHDMQFEKPGITIPTHMHEMTHDKSTGPNAGRCGSTRYNYSVPLELQDEVTPSKFALLTWGESISYVKP